MAPNPNFPRYPECVAVVGPRRSGKTVLANAVAASLAAIHKPNPVLIIRENGKEDEVCFDDGDPVLRWGKVIKNSKLATYRAIVYDGALPAYPPAPLRVISCSELNV